MRPIKMYEFSFVASKRKKNFISSKMEKPAIFTCMLQIRYRIGSPRQCVDWHRRICCAMPPSQLREHVDQFVQALQPFLPRFSSSFSAASGCESHAWPPNVLLPCTFCWLIRFSCCWCCRCRWWCLCWRSLGCFSRCCCCCGCCCCCPVTIVHKMHNRRLCKNE